MRKKLFYVLIFVLFYQSCNLLRNDSAQYGYLRKIPASDNKDDFSQVSILPTNSQSLSNKNVTFQNVNETGNVYNPMVYETHPNQITTNINFRKFFSLVEYNKYSRKYFPIRHNAFLKMAPEGKEIQFSKNFDDTDLIVLILIIAVVLAVLLVMIFYYYPPSTDTGCCLLFFVLLLAALLIGGIFTLLE